MISAVMMAGYNNKRAVKRYSKIVAEHYGEKFIETGYKPLREFEAVEDGKRVSKPVIQFTLEKLFECDLIGEIVIVGHQMLLEHRLRKVIAAYDKPCKIINQNSAIPKDAIRRFNIIPKKFKHNSLAGNMIKGYRASAAYQRKEHALFVASDSPLTTHQFIEGFIQAAQKHNQASAIIFPAVNIDGKQDKLGRKPLWLINDTSYTVSGGKDRYGRQGFRLSSLMTADLHRFDVNSANKAYNLRKTLNPKVQIRLFKATRGLGYSNVYSKHFIKKNLSITECGKITSAFFKGKLTLIPMEGQNATYDYDGTDREYTGIMDMLRNTSHSDED